MARDPITVASALEDDARGHVDLKKLRSVQIPVQSKDVITPSVKLGPRRSLELSLTPALSPER